MGFSTKEQMQKFLTRWPSPNTMLCGAAIESTDVGAPQDTERTPPAETKPELAASAEANVRHLFNYQVKILGTLANSQDYEFTISVPAKDKSDAINNAIQVLPDIGINPENVHMAQANKISS